MKTLQVVLSIAFVAGSQGQSASSVPNQGTIPQDTPYTVVQKDANSRIWERTTYEQLPNGDVVPHINRYQEVATGLNFRDPDTGEWEASSEIIEPIAGGAAAQYGQHKVIFAADIATFGAINMETPDGQRLQSHLLGLSYFDRSSGQSVFIAQVTNSIGQLISSNQVWYDNAFTGVRAGVRYTYTRDGFEQDVILEEQPPTPEEYGLNSATTVLQAFTEFISPPVPTVLVDSAVPSGQLSDATLSFGTMKIGRGRAFLMGSMGDGCAVSKEWITLEGRQFLVEEVPVPQIAKELQALPTSQANLMQFSNSVVNVVSLKRLLPTQLLAKVRTKQMKIASLLPKGPSFVLDYNSVNTSQTNYTFQGDTTYFISGNISLYGTNTTFEGGTVLKYASGVSLTVNTPVSWLGDVYRPVLMLAKDDNTIGQSISGSTGNPGNSYYATKALYFDGTSALTNLNIQNLRILNANAGVVINGQSNHVLSDLQVVKCGNGVVATNTDFSLRNALFSVVATNFSGSSATGRVEHLTSDMAIWLNKDMGANLFLTNCLLSAVTNLGSCTTQSVATVSSGSGVFQTVGGGSYYLANGSPYRDAGTTGINPDLFVRLSRKTTYPPVLCINSNFNAVTSLGPQVHRDADIPDLGYHYEPLDYVFSGVSINSNMTISAGTAIGWFKTNSNPYAVRMNDDIILTFNGLFDEPDYFVRSTTVQEGNGQWVGNGAIGIAGSQNQSSQNVSLSSELHMSFTTMAGFVGTDQQFRDYSGYLTVRGSHSTLAGGNTAGYVISYYLTNCLMDNQQIGQVQGSPGNEVYLRNCTLHNGAFYSSRSRAIPISARDCSFDNTLLSISDAYSTNPTNTDYDYNAYTNTVDPFPIGGTHDKNSVVFNWQTGPLGRFYLPINSVLIDAGDLTADTVGLYQFTTQTNQLEETNSTVDIGYHYLAIGDADNDGLPDLWEYYWFGTYTNSGNDLDSQGNTLLYDYENGLDPNIINFTVQMGNQHFNTTNAVGSFMVLAGSPGYEAVLVDNTNFGSALWTRYDGTVNLNLGVTDGVHQVWLGLKGVATNGTPTWIGTSVYLDRTPPVLTITNPIISTVMQPYIQVQGIASERIASIRYDLSNALGMVTGQVASVTGEFLDTNILAFTTNYFQCYDVPVTNGINTVTVHATDLAGNSTSTNISYTLDYSSKTNPPTITLTWPSDGVHVAQTNFTVYGQLSDPTAAISVQVTNITGITNAIAGAVERDGHFWIQNVPLSLGTNWLTLTTRDVVGNVSMASLKVIQDNTLEFTINPVATDLWKMTATVSGTISDKSYAVTVNGVAASNDGSGNWTAYNVPNNPGNMATYQAEATSPGNNPQEAQSTIVKPLELTLTSATWNDSSEAPSGPDSHQTSDTTWNFTAGSGGHWHKHIQNDEPGGGDSATWDASINSDGSVSSYVYTGSDGTVSTGYDFGDVYDGPSWMVNFAQEVGSLTVSASADWHETTAGQATWQLHVGSLGVPGNYPNVVVLTGTANNQVQGAGDVEGMIVNGDDLLGPQITNTGKQEDTNFDVYLLMADGASTASTIQPNTPLTFVANQAAQFKLIHATACTAPDNPDDTRTEIGIGEIVDFWNMPGNTTWSVSGNAVIAPTIGNSTTLIAKLEPGSAAVTPKVGDLTLPPVSFTIDKPSSLSVVDHTDAPLGSQDPMGVLMGAETRYSDFVNPTTVSFANVSFREGTNPPSITLNWPNGEVDTNTFDRDSWGLSCGSSQIGDQITSFGGTVTKFLIYNGTSFQSVSFSYSFADQYQDDNGVWNDFQTVPITIDYNSSGACRITYMGVAGGWQGPY